MIERAELSVESLTVDPVQSRSQPWSGDETDKQLATSIDEDGFYHDVLVRPLDAVDVGVTTDTPDGSEGGQDTSNPQYAIIAGSRRYHAAMEAGRETLPCKILTADDLDAAWASLNENTDRRPLSEQEIASQLNLIYELVKPTSSDDATDSNTSDAETPLSVDRFETEEAALEYLAERYYGRTDDNAISLIEGHLRTANLPPVLQSLFKAADERTARERTALDNFGIDARTTLGSGEGKSGTSREVVALHETLADELAADSLDATDAVLDAVGSLQHDEMSEQELRRSLREFRNEVSAELDASAVDQHDQTFRETLQRHAEQLRELHEEIEPKRPFKKVDVLGPETHRHSRYHAHAMQTRNADSHSDLVRTLYTERLETLAEKQGWD
jgi:uncharacterized ParB-like nuclease family protein